MALALVAPSHKSLILSELTMHHGMQSKQDAAEYGSWTSPAAPTRLARPLRGASSRYRPALGLAESDDSVLPCLEAEPVAFTGCIRNVTALQRYFVTNPAANMRALDGRPGFRSSEVR